MRFSLGRVLRSLLRPGAAPPASSAAIAAPAGMASLPVALFEQDLELKYTAVHASPTLAALLAPGMGDAELLPADEAAVLTNLKRSVLETGARLREEVRLSVEGTPSDFELALEPRRTPEGTVNGVAGALVDIAGRKRAEQALLELQDQLDRELVTLRVELAEARLERERERQGREQAERALDELEDHDTLTGLPSRRLFHDRLTIAVVHARRQGQKLAVVVVGLDGFSALNDSLGRDIGDDLLRGVARLLEQRLRQGDTVARLGGDEFTMVLPGIRRDEDIAKVAEKIRLSLGHQITLGSRDIAVTASLGIAVYPEDGPDSETLLRSAGVSLARAKERGGDCYDIHAPHTHAIAAGWQALETALRRALAKGELMLHYQPIVETEGGRVVSVEALLRFGNLDRRLVPATDFTRLVDSTTLAVPLGQWALKTACTQAASWRSGGHGSLGVAVNLSLRQVLHPALVRLVRGGLEAACLPPSALTLEIAEGALSEGGERAIERLRDLKALGVRIAVDEFGTGEALLAQLHRYPVDILKIDSGVIAGIATDRSSEAVAIAAIALARSRQLSVVAEGVETEEQRQLLRRWHCDRIQGNLVAAPAPAEDLERFLELTREASAP